METNQIGRRHVLRNAGIAAGGALLATAATSSPALAGRDETDHASALTGGWFLDRQDAVSGTVRGVVTFGAGGTVHYQDIAPASVVVLTGSWSRTGRAFRFEMWAGVAADTATGAPAITVRIQGTLTVTARTFTSPYAVTWFDPATQSELFGFNGTATGTRIEP